jgi:hypothetical protein
MYELSEALWELLGFKWWLVFFAVIVVSVLVRDWETHKAEPQGKADYEHWLQQSERVRVWDIKKTIDPSYNEPEPPAPGKIPYRITHPISIGLAIFDFFFMNFCIFFSIEEYKSIKEDVEEQAEKAHRKQQKKGNHDGIT